ncbi:MAG: arginine--tRNA ligase [Candidatus Omnitrophica bacterium]|nr:arginine--tRNA ligase [Candidatus Omnitrophota bacterium]
MDITKELSHIIQGCVKQAQEEFSFTVAPDIVLERPPKTDFGDLSTNAAMQLCKINQSPKLKETADFLCRRLKDSIAGTQFSGYIKEIFVMPPAFINFRFANKVFYDLVLNIEKEKVSFAKRNFAQGKKVIVEFVSANPTGPLTVAHARQAVVGDAISNILEFFGWKVVREYYLNDEGNQINVLAASIYARYAELAGVTFEFPQDGYKGDYVKDIAKEIFNEHKNKFKVFSEKEKEFFGQYGVSVILKDIEKDLKDIGVAFDNYTSQHKFARTGKIEKSLKTLKDKGLIYEKEGAAWFKSTEFGDDKDRVLIKSDGTYTYITPDIAYHRDKYERGFDWLIDIWGPDHHGYIPRMRAAQRALGKKDDSLSVIIIQLATIYRGSKPVRMSTRNAEYITLREVIDEVGPDVSKFFFLTRKNSSHLDFDIELAKTESPENPVYYIQYAHARICGILKRSSELNKSCAAAEKVNLELLNKNEEINLLKVLGDYPRVLQAAYETLEPYRILEYLLELSKVFHSFYTVHKVITDDAELTGARIVLINAVKTILSDALNLLGISIPEKM